MRDLTPVRKARMRGVNYTSRLVFFSPLRQQPPMLHGNLPLKRRGLSEAICDTAWRSAVQSQKFQGASARQAQSSFSVLDIANFIVVKSQLGAKAPPLQFGHYLICHFWLNNLSLLLIRYTRNRYTYWHQYCRGSRHGGVRESTGHRRRHGLPLPVVQVQ